MKAVILAGGFGTRLGSLTENVPKPMVKVGRDPLILHIMRIFAKFGISEFVIAAGYKSDVIKDYFVGLYRNSGDLTVDTASGKLVRHGNRTPKWTVTIADSGEDALTASRLRQLRPYLQDEPFLLTYGDGVADVNISKLVEFHKRNRKIATITAVRPNARFGELQIMDGKVLSFEEKPQLIQGWINGGFMVLEPEVFDSFPPGNVMLEREPMEKLVADGQLMAFHHEGFWQCMDTKRDLDYLQALWDSGEAPWA